MCRDSEQLTIAAIGSLPCGGDDLPDDLADARLRCGEERAAEHVRMGGAAEIRNSRTILGDDRETLDIGKAGEIFEDAQGRAGRPGERGVVADDDEAEPPRHVMREVMLNDAGAAEIVLRVAFRHVGGRESFARRAILAHAVGDEMEDRAGADLRPVGGAIVPGVQHRMR